jgi:hypothetical protein
VAQRRRQRDRAGPQSQPGPCGGGDALGGEERGPARQAAGVEMSRSMGGGGGEDRGGGSRPGDQRGRKRMMCGNFFWTRRG